MFPVGRFMMEKDRNDKNIGKKLDGRYEITERIGEGGMADVYRANDVVDKKTVAVKILKKEFAENEEFLRRFRNESKAIALLSHPNIVKIYDVGFSDRIQFIVMEYIDGITLNEYMEQSSPLDWKDAAHFVMQILRALQHAHNKGIVHRDIKPQNIMMLRDGTIKVMDFGIAKFARENGKTCTDKAIGTVHYISPEQARGAETDEKSDLYSVGVLLFEMLTGKKPFDTETNDPVSIAVMHMQAEVPRPSSIHADLAAGLEEIILKAMQKEPAKRYQSAAEMMNDIEAFKENPEIIFGYFPDVTGEATDDAKTRFFTPVSEKEEVPSVVEVEETAEEEEAEIDEDDDYDEDYEDDDDDEDEYEEEEEERSSLFVPILTAVIIVVIVVGLVFICSRIINWIEGGIGTNTTQEWKMPSLINMDYQTALDQYGDKIQIVSESEEYSELEKGKIFWQAIPENDPVSIGSTVKVKVSKGTRTIKLPNYNEWDYETASTLIRGLGLEVDPRYSYSDDVPEGKIISTDPQGPTEVEPGAFITITVSKGKNIETVDVPNFINMTWAVAKETAELYELELNKEEVNSSEEMGIVLSQSINPGEPVTKGTPISLKVSNGVPEAKTVKVAFAIPTDAKGNFHITFYEGGAVKQQGSSFNVDLATGTTYVEVSGVGTTTLVATLTNEENGKTATIGSYNINFDKNQTNVVSSDIASAFKNVDGIPSQTSPTSSTTTTTTTTLSGSSSSTTSTTAASSTTTTTTTPPVVSNDETAAPAAE